MSSSRTGKDRWHALFVFRILLHDAFVDTVPSGYSKNSANPDRPGFRHNAITLDDWLAGLAVNALCSLTATLPPQFKFAHSRTLRRWWLQQHLQHLNAKKLRLPWLGDRLVLYSLDDADDTQQGRARALCRYQARAR